MDPPRHLYDNVPVSVLDRGSHHWYRTPKPEASQSLLDALQWAKMLSKYFFDFLKNILNFLKMLKFSDFS